MGDTHTLPLDATTNVELTNEEFNQIQKDYNLYTINNPDLSLQVKHDYLIGLFTPYII